MADFLLSVGLNTDVSLDQMQKDISNIITKLNETPQKIKLGVEIDRASVDKFREEIAGISRMIQGFGSISLVSGSADGLTGTVRAVEAVADVAQRATSSLHSLSATVAESNLKTIKDALSGMEGLPASAVDDITRRLNEANVTVTKAKTTVSDIGKEGEKVRSLVVQGHDALGNTIKRTITFQQKTGEIKRDLTEITASFGKVESKTTGTAKRAEKLSEEFRQAKQAVRDYYSELLALEKNPAARADIVANDKGVYSSKSGEFDALAQKLNRVKNAYDTATAASNNFSAAEREKFTQFSVNAQMDYAAALEKVRNATKNKQNAEAESNRQSKESLEIQRLRATVMDSSATALTQGEKALKDWSRAEKSSSESSRTAYRDIANKTEALRQARAAYDGSDESVRKLSDAEKELRSALKNQGAIIKKNGDATKSWGDRIVGLAKKFTTWFGVSRIIMAIYRALRKMVTAVIEVDTAMTELKKVTNETEARYNSFLDNATVRAKRLGATLKDTITSTADFARLGYSIEDAEKLADVAIIYKNVGDGIEDIDDASESIIATMQGFGKTADEAMLIVDKFNEVGNNFAISSGGIGEALLRSAAAMHSANNTLDETIALATAANTVVQDPDKVGTTLKTVSMFLRAAKTEAEDAGESTDGMAKSVSELRKEILALTGGEVDIQLDEDTYKSTYQILQELSKVWDKLSDVSQANILELVGGKRNSNVVAALLENFSTAEDVLAKSAGAAGSALKENEKVLESVQGKINVMKAGFEELGLNLIGTDFLKLCVNIATQLLEGCNAVLKFIDACGGLKTVLFAVGAILMANEAAWVAHAASMAANFIVTTLTKALTGVWTTLKNLVLAIPNCIKAWVAYGTATTTAAAGQTALATAVQSTIPAIGAILAIVTAVVGGFSFYNSKVDESRQKQTEAAKAASDLTQEIKDLSKEWAELKKSYQEGTASKEDLLSAEDDLIDKLGIERNRLQELIDKYGDYSKAIKQARIDKIKDSEKDLFGGIEAAESEMELPTLFLFPSEVKNNKEELKKTFDALSEAGFIANSELNSLYNSINDEIDYISKTSSVYSSVFKFNFDDARTGSFSTSEDIVAYYTELNDILNFLYEEYGTDNKLYRVIKQAYDASIEEVDVYKEAVSDWNAEMAEVAILEYEIANGTPNTEKEFLAYRDAIVENAFAAGKLVGSKKDIASAIDDILRKESDYIQFYELIDGKINQNTSDTEKYINKISALQKLAAGFDQLDKIYADVKDGGFLDTSFINEEDFKNAFGDLGESYDTFIKTIIESPDDISACQKAFNSLTAAYISSSGVLDDVTEETKKLTVAYLENKGVANAATIVDQALAYKKEYLKYTTGEYSDITEEEIEKLYKECEAGTVAHQVLSRLSLEKELANRNAINTSSDVDNLISLANAASATTASVTKLTHAKTILAQAEKLQRDIAFGNSTVSLKEVTKLRIEADNLLKEAIKYQTFNPNTFKYTGASTSNKTDSSKDKEDTWFDKEYAKHQHLVAMDKETQKDYLKWLDSAYQKAYKEGIIELDDYYKYREEVYEGLRELFKEYLSDTEHEISLRENYDGEAANILKLYKKLISDVEKELTTAKKQGLDDTDEYIQELQDKWQDYVDACKEMEEEAIESAKDAVDELVEYRIDMIKQDIEDEKDALDKKLDNLKEFYDKQKDMLQDKYDEEKYLEEQAEKRKTVSDLQAELKMLEKDDSAWAQKRKLELKEELSTAEKDLKDFEKDKALDLALDALDKAYESQESQIQAEMDALEERLNDPHALYNQALSEIRENTGGLYDEMIEYNRKYGTGNDEDIKETYEEAYKVLLGYKDLFGEDYKGIVLPNSTNYIPNVYPGSNQNTSGSTSNSSSASSSSTTNKNQQSSNTTTTNKTSPTLSEGSSIKVKKTASKFSDGTTMASFVPGGTYTVYGVSSNGKEVLIGRDGVYTGWINKTDIEGYASGTRHATAGMHEVDEIGSEYLFTSKDGSHYRILNDGDLVFNAGASRFLYDFANSGGDILKKIIKSVFDTTVFDRIAPSIIQNEIVMGDIVVTGSADTRTVSEIRRTQRENVDYMLREFVKLSK